MAKFLDETMSLLLIFDYSFFHFISLAFLCLVIVVLCEFLRWSLVIIHLWLFFLSSYFSCFLTPSSSSSSILWISLIVFFFFYYFFISPASLNLIIVVIVLSCLNSWDETLSLLILFKHFISLHITVTLSYLNFLGKTLSF